MTRRRISCRLHSSRASPSCLPCIPRCPRTAGRSDFTIDSPTLLMPLVRQGKLRALAVTMAGRSTLLPGLPGLQEAGVPDYDNAAWTMIFVRPGTPAPALAALRAAAALAV